MSTIGIPAGHEQADEFQSLARGRYLVGLVTRWCQSLQRRRSTPALPDDAREQLRRDRLLAELRLQRLSMRVRPPL